MISLILYAAISYIFILNITSWANIYNKLNIISDIGNYNHLYLSMYYIIFSTCLMFENLNFHNKKKNIIKSIAYVFMCISIYKYHMIKIFIKMLLITNVLILSFYNLYKKCTDFR